MPLLMPHPLHQAIADGDLDEVKRQIADLPVDRTDLVADNGRTGYTPLARAAFHGQVNIGWHEVGRPWSALRLHPSAPP